MSDIQPDLGGRTSGGVGRRIASNTGLLLGAKILGTLLGVGTLLIATGSLTPAEFGTIVFLHAYMLFFAEVATFQSWQSVIRFGTDDVTNGDVDGLSRLLRFGYTLDFVSVALGYMLAVGAFGLVVMIADRLPGLSPGEGVDIHALQALVTLYCLVILVRFTSTSVGIFRLFDKFVVLGAEALVMPVVRFAGAALAAWQGWGLTGFAAAWFVGSFAQYVFLWTAGVLELRKRGLLGPVLRARMRFFRPHRPIWGFVVKSNIDSTLATGVMHLPQLLVMALFGPVWNGVFKIAEEVAKLLTEGFKLLDQVIYPELAKLVSMGRADRIWRIVTRSSAILLSVGLAFSALIFLFGEPVLTSIFGADYAQAVPLAALLVPAAALMGAAAPLYPIFYATDRPGRAVMIRGAALAVYIAAFLIAADIVGELAPGFASLAANGFAVVILIFAARHAVRSAHRSPGAERADAERAA
ncbi:lipopolysaccharide biosynthesis protein [uncultured Algimonas sp.]|uniref:lipopolysaccharide biosynthesis protein n=1 Tax=uncultured Algimonas sp. TaxID=1547920 RepID=UPI0026123763|nr:lipopolysaccharide biosynthesis protein [uncultured Algimonas sp.]